MAEKLAGNACTGLNDMPGVARGAIAGGVGGAAGGLVAGLGMIAGVAIVRDPVGLCVGTGAIFGTYMGGVVGAVCKSSPGAMAARLVAQSAGSSHI